MWLNLDARNAHLAVLNQDFADRRQLGIPYGRLQTENFDRDNSRGCFADVGGLVNDCRVAKRDVALLNALFLRCAVVIADPELRIGEEDDSRFDRMRMQERLLARGQTGLHDTDVPVLESQVMMRFKCTRQ